MERWWRRLKERRIREIVAKTERKENKRDTGGNFWLRECVREKEVVVRTMAERGQGIQRGNMARRILNGRGKGNQTE